MTTQAKEKTELQIIIDPGLRTVWVDHMVIAKRLDGMSCVRLSTNLPEGVTEQMRFMSSEQHLKKFVDGLCANLDYYPIKAVVEAPPKTKKQSK